MGAHGRAAGALRDARLLVDRKHGSGRDLPLVLPLDRIRTGVSRPAAKPGSALTRPTPMIAKSVHSNAVGSSILRAANARSVTLRRESACTPLPPARPPADLSPHRPHGRRDRGSRGSRRATAAGPGRPCTRLCRDDEGVHHSRAAHLRRARRRVPDQSDRDRRRWRRRGRPPRRRHCTRVGRRRGRRRRHSVLHLQRPSRQCAAHQRWRRRRRRLHFRRKRPSGRKVDRNPPRPRKQRRRRLRR